MNKPGVILLNFGGPQGPNELEPFLHALFDDVLPFPSWIRGFAAGIIARRRAPKVLPAYTHIGWSPVVPTTIAQRDAVAAALAERGVQVPIAAGMMYTAPSVRSAVDELDRAGVDGLIAVAMFPQYSTYTTGSAFTMLAAALDASGRGAWPVHYIPAYYARPSYIGAVVDTVRGAIDRLGPPDPTRPRHLLFSPHGVPTAGQASGDPYPDQTRETCRRVVEALGGSTPWSIGWQSRVGPTRWFEPSTVDEVRRLGACGVRELVVVPISFVGEHIETLEELDVEVAGVAKSAGITSYARAAALGLHPGLIEAIAAEITDAVAQIGAYRCFRCLVPREAAHRTQGRCPSCKATIPAFLHRHPAADPAPPSPTSRP